MTFEPHGVSPALVTPFTKDGGKIDEAAYRRLIRFCIDTLGVDGLLAAGTTGEFTSLNFEEHKQVLRIAVEEAAGKAFVLAGAGSSSTKITVELVKYAETIGADAALVVSPYYLRPTSRGLYEHYRIVSEIGDDYNKNKHDNDFNPQCTIWIDHVVACIDKEKGNNIHVL